MRGIIDNTYDVFPVYIYSKQKLLFQPYGLDQVLNDFRLLSKETTIWPKQPLFQKQFQLVNW